MTIRQRNRMIRVNIKLVAWVAKQHIHCGLSMGDLIQYGMFGLIRAVELFNPAWKCKFSSYAVPAIRGKILRAIELMRRYRSREVELPEKLYAKDDEAENHQYRKEQLLDINTWMETVLTERERKVIQMRFGLIDGWPFTLEDAGYEIGITRERCRQIENKAMWKLKRQVEIVKSRDGDYDEPGL